MKTNKNIDPSKVFSEFKNGLTELGNDIRESELNNKEISEIQEELKGIELELLRAKVATKLDRLKIDDPYLTSKEALVTILDVLPSDTNKTHLSKLTAFVLNNWEVKARKLCA